jgi:uncharacterized protein (DUF934 family)
MAALARDGRIVPDGWHWLREIPTDLAALPPGDLIVPLSFWETDRAALDGRGGQVGVWLDAHEEPETLVGAFDRITLIGLHFPSAVDGRSLSSAMILRTRLGWCGELRALGEVRRDQLSYMHRCGFDSFLLPSDEDPQNALAGLSALSASYQADARSWARAAPAQSRRVG